MKKLKGIGPNGLGSPLKQSKKTIKEVSDSLNVNYNNELLKYQTKLDSISQHHADLFQEEVDKRYNTLTGPEYNKQIEEFNESLNLDKEE